MASPKIRRLRLLAAGLVVAVVVTTLTLSLRVPPRLPWSGYIRLLVVKQTNAVASSTPYNPYFLQNLFDDIKRTTANPDFIRTLGKVFQPRNEPIPVSRGIPVPQYLHH